MGIESLVDKMDGIGSQEDEHVMIIIFLQETQLSFFPFSLNLISSLNKPFPWLFTSLWSQRRWTSCARWIVAELD
jgi:hypothetical protein